MLITFAIYASIITGAIWVGLLTWLGYRWFRLSHAFNSKKEISPEQRNYD